jgi:hypothetical protein
MLLLVLVRCHRVLLLRHHMVRLQVLRVHLLSLSMSMIMVVLLLG